MNQRRSMYCYAIWSSLCALLLALACLPLYRQGDTTALYLLALALWHTIYAIWFFKGASLQAFARASVAGRVMTGSMYLGMLLNYGQPPATVFGLYLLIQGAADLASALMTALALRREPAVVRIPQPMSAARLNRLVFAVYMLLLAVWMRAGTDSFLDFFRLPSPGHQDLGPISALALHIGLLAGYNLVAVRHTLLPLIDAGMKGGTTAFLFVLLLVTAGLLHPRTLLLPLADVISIVLLLTRRLRRSRSGELTPPPASMKAVRKPGA